MNSKNYCVPDEEDGSYLHRWLAKRSAKELSVETLNDLDKSAIRWLCINLGYEQVGKISKRRDIFDHVTQFFTAIIILRGILVVLIPYKSVQTLLGDLYIDTPAHGIQNTLITMLMILANGIRFFGFLTERRGAIESLRFYHRLKLSKFDCKRYRLTPADCLRNRRAFYLFSRFYFFAAPATSVGIAVCSIVALVTNPINYENASNFVICVFWLILTLTAFTLGAYATIWLYIANTMIMSFSTFALNSNHSFGSSLVRTGSHARQKDLFRYFAHQNRIYNFIDQSIVDLGQVLSYGIVVVSGVANFAFFASFFVGTDSPVVDSVILAIAIMAFSAIVVINFLSALVVGKVSLCHLTNYQIARRCKLHPSTKLKLMATCERLNVKKIGFTLGGMFTMDSHSFFIVRGVH